MKNGAFAVLIVILSIFTAGADPYDFTVVANRSGSSISLLDVGSAGEIREIGSRKLGFDFEPMYCSLFRQTSAGGPSDSIVFGDGKNDQVVFLDGMAGTVRQRVTVGKGVIHQFADRTLPNLLVVATDIEKGFTVVEYKRPPSSGGGFETRRFNLPQTFTSGKPHDIIADQKYVYLSVLGVQSDGKTFDALLQVDQVSLQIVATREFSKEIHLFSPAAAPYFIVVEQESGTIRLIEKETLNDLARVAGPKGGHGVFASRDGKNIFVTNIEAAAGADSILPSEWYRVQKA
ncbi:MAG: hypothetical protein EOP09_02445 [Proteobacteria bacterium]|nr:MAG: hypothetical protein EOP09_02445 [Pseudomonadota bacterium]